MEYLFEKEYPEKKPESKEFCKNCENIKVVKYRSGKNNYFCKVMLDRKTDNGLKKIKYNQKSCPAFEKRDGKIDCICVH